MQSLKKDISITQILSSLENLVSQHQTKIPYFLWLVLFIAFFTTNILSPVRFTDTDLWYHLNSGRYLFQNHAIADSTFFSFLDPKNWANYYWGFQAIAFSIFDTLGYQGLIIFKSVLLTLTAFIASKIICKNGIKDIGYVELFLLSLIFSVIVSRGEIIRPHLFTYLFIPLAIYLLTYKNKYLWALPILTLFWANTHGITWPVGAAILGAFTLQSVYNYNLTKNSNDRNLITWCIASIPMLFITPSGLSILYAPFASDPDIYLFITELKPHDFALSLSKFFSSDFFISDDGVLILIQFAFIYAFLTTLKTSKKNISTIILSLCGLALYSKGFRFTWEWMFLSLPLLSLLPKTLPINIKATSTLLVSLVIMIYSPLSSWTNKHTYYYNYPIDNYMLPIGVVNYLKSKNVGSRLIASPSYAGYFQWHLYPNLLIHSDMQLPPFTTEEYFELSLGLTSTYGLKNITEKYNPDYVVSIKSNSYFKDIAEQTKIYKPIYFDDMFVLYINSEKYPTESNTEILKYIDPYSPYTYDSENADNHVKEFEKIVSIYPEIPGSLSSLITLYMTNERHEEALPYAQILEEKFSQQPGTHLIIAALHDGLDNFKEALKHFELALEYNYTVKPEVLHKYIAESYYQLEDYKNSYKYYKLGFNMYTRDEKPEYYFQYAYSSVIVGDLNNAKKLLTTLLTYRKSEDYKFIENAKELLKKIEDGHFKASLFQ